jgi:hypothetical protein
MDKHGLMAAAYMKYMLTCFLWTFLDHMQIVYYSLWLNRNSLNSLTAQFFSWSSQYKLEPHDSINDKLLILIQLGAAAAEAE